MKSKPPETRPYRVPRATCTRSKCKLIKKTDWAMYPDSGVSTHRVREHISREHPTGTSRRRVSVSPSIALLGPLGGVRGVSRRPRAHHLAGHPCCRRLLDTALVRAAGDLDETSISTERRPRVHHSPVRPPLLDPPADDLDSDTALPPRGPCACFERRYTPPLYCARHPSMPTQSERRSRCSGGNPEHSEVNSSEVIRGTQRSSEVIRGTCTQRVSGTQWQSGNLKHSEEIRGHQWPSEVIRGTQRSSEGPQRSS